MGRLLLTVLFFFVASLASPVFLSAPPDSELFSSLYYAFASYESNTTLGPWDCCWCRKNPNFFIVAVLQNHTTETQGFVGYVKGDEPYVVVSFRGTTNIENWILDLDPREVKTFYNTTIHKGFYEAFESLKSQLYVGIQVTLDICLTCYRKLVITGHSLGASISEVAAVDIAKSPYNFQEIQSINFGRF